MSTIEESIYVNAPIRKVYSQWTEITEQLPDKRIAWRSRSGASHVGVVTFHALNDWQTRIMIQMEYEPEGIIENAGDALGFTTRRIENDLERLRSLSRLAATRQALGAAELSAALDSW